MGRFIFGQARLRAIRPTAKAARRLSAGPVIFDKLWQRLG